MTGGRPQQITKLADGVTHFQSGTWRCNAVTVDRGAHALIVDACWTRTEVEAIAQTVQGRRVHLLVTHADPDHACGVPLMRGALVVAGSRTAERIADGSAARELAHELEAWGLQQPTDLRVDEVVEADTELVLEGARVRTIEARGHAFDGIAFLLRESGVFATGDYLSASMYPMVWWSLEEMRRSTERIAAALEHFDVRVVVPGHGPVLTPSEASAIANEDIRYLDAITAAADSAQRSGASLRDWLVSVHSIRPPRAADPDIEIYCPLILNAAGTFRDRGVNPLLIVGLLG